MGILVKIGADLSGYQTAMKQMRKDMAGLQNIGKTMIGVGAGLTATVTVPIVAIGTAAVKSSIEFETSMAKVSTIADSTSKPIGTLKDEILKLSSQMGIGANDIAEATYQAISAGVDTADAVNFVAQATQLAKGGFTDVTSAVDVMSTALNAYGLEASDAAHVSDVLIQTQNKGKTTVDELASQIGRVIPTANAYGVSLEQLGAAYSVMTANGINTQQSTTALTALFNELGKDGSAGSNILEKQTGKSFKDLTDSGASLRDVLGIIEDGADKSGTSFQGLFSSSEAAKAGLTLLNTSQDDYNQSLGEFLSASGDTQEAYDKVSDTIQEKLNVALETGRNALISVGDTITEMLLPIISVVTDIIAKLAGWFDGLSDAQKRVVVVIGAVVAAIGPLLIIGGTLLIFLSQASIALAGLGLTFGAVAWPILAIVAVVAAVIAIFVLFGDEITAFYEQYLKPFVDKAIAIIKDTLQPVFEQVFDTISSIVKGAFEIIQKLWNEILAPVFKIIMDLITNVFLPIWTTGFSAAMEVVKGWFSGIKEVWENGIKPIFTGIIDFISGVFSGNWGKAWDGIVSVFKGIIGGIVAAIKIPINVIIDLINGFIKGINRIKIPDWVPVVGGKGINIPTIPRLKVGMDFVPSDYFPAYLDYGERVLTKEDNARFNQLGGIHGMEQALQGNQAGETNQANQATPQEQNTYNYSGMFDGAVINWSGKEDIMETMRQIAWVTQTRQAGGLT